MRYAVAVHLGISLFFHDNFRMCMRFFFSRYFTFMIFMTFMSAKFHKLFYNINNISRSLILCKQTIDRNVFYFLFCLEGYFPSMDLGWLTLNQSLIVLYFSGLIDEIHMRCSHHIEHDMQSQFGILMQMNEKWPCHSTKTNGREKTDLLTTATTKN